LAFPRSIIQFCSHFLSFVARPTLFGDSPNFSLSKRGGYDDDKDQKFVYELVVNLDKLEPTVACHPDPGQRKKAKDMENVKLDRAYIGSCTGGKTSDFVEFARVLQGKHVSIDTFGVPASVSSPRAFVPL